MRAHVQRSALIARERVGQALSRCSRAAGPSSRRSESGGARTAIVAYSHAILACMHATGTATDAGALAAGLAAFYGHAMRPSNRLIAEFERLDLSFTQFKALSAATEGEPTVKELAERLGLSLPGASRAVDQLARRGLLDRREDADDRRCKRLSVTDAGRELVHRLDDARRDALEAFAEGIDPAHRERLLAALTPVLEDLETSR